jgi:hypothetical protein
MIKINLHACAAFVQALKFSIFHCCVNGAAMSTSFLGAAPLLVLRHTKLLPQVADALILHP